MADVRGTTALGLASIRAYLLSGISNQMSSNSGQTTEKANTVAAAAEEMSANLLES